MFFSSVVFLISINSVSAQPTDDSKNIELITKNYIKQDWGIEFVLPNDYGVIDIGDKYSILVVKQQSWDEFRVSGKLPEQITIRLGGDLSSVLQKLKNAPKISTSEIEINDRKFTVVTKEWDTKYSIPITKVYLNKLENSTMIFSLDSVDYSYVVLDDFVNKMKINKIGPVTINDNVESVKNSQKNRQAINKSHADKTMGVPDLKLITGKYIKKDWGLVFEVPTNYGLIDNGIGPILAVTKKSWSENKSPDYTSNLITVSLSEPFPKTIRELKKFCDVTVSSKKIGDTKFFIGIYECRTGKIGKLKFYSTSLDDSSSLTFSSLYVDKNSFKNLDNFVKTLKFKKSSYN